MDEERLVARLAKPNDLVCNADGLVCRVMRLTVTGDWLTWCGGAVFYPRTVEGLALNCLGCIAVCP